MTFDDLLPYRPVWGPLPWLEIGGGLLLWNFAVEYRHRHIVPGLKEIEVRVTFRAPSVTEPGAPVSAIVSSRAFNVEEFSVIGPDMARQCIMEAVREMAEHEVLESLRVGGSPFFGREVDAGHGAGDARR